MGEAAPSLALSHCNDSVGGYLLYLCCMARRRTPLALKMIQERAKRVYVHQDVWHESSHQEEETLKQYSSVCDRQRRQELLLTRRPLQADGP